MTEREAWELLARAWAKRPRVSDPWVGTGYGLCSSIAHSVGARLRRRMRKRLRTNRPLHTYERDYYWGAGVRAPRVRFCRLMAAQCAAEERKKTRKARKR